MKLIKEILNECWRDWQRDWHPIDNKIEEVYEAIPGFNMSTPNNLTLINEIVKRTEARIYLEAGVWVGHSILAAAIYNPRTMCVGLEDFSDNPQERRLKEATQIFPKNIRIYRIPFQEFFPLLEETVTDKGIDVYYYDADHSYKATLEGLEMPQPYLSDDCYILVDDINMTQVRSAVDKFVESSEWEEVFTIEGRQNPDEKHPWYNGTAILRRNV